MIALTTGYNFVENQNDALRNISMSQEVIIDLLDSIISEVDDEDMNKLVEVARSLNAAAKLYLGPQEGFQT